METNDQEITLLPPPPSVIRTLIRGFNTVASHIYLIILPVLLDLFLWLGPQVKANPVFDELAMLIKQTGQQLPQDANTILSEFSANFNLLSVLRTVPVGVFSLFSASLSTGSPLGQRMVLLTSTVQDVLLALLAANFIGMVLGAIFFHTVAKVSLQPKKDISLIRQILNVLGLNIVWTIFFILMYVPIILAALLISAIPDPIRTIVGLLLMIPASWFAMFYYYSFFPIFLFDVNIPESIRFTFKTIRFGLPTLGWFSIVTLLLSQGMDYLWRSAPATSWMSAVGILGHGFIATGLLSASFIYFLENMFWIELTLKRLNKSTEPGLPVNETNNGG